MKIGVCGTGRMGAAIAQRLIAVGHEVGVWNRDAKKTQPLTDAGARLYASPTELAGGCEAVVVMLLNDAATEAARCVGRQRLPGSGRRRSVRTLERATREYAPSTGVSFR